MQKYALFVIFIIFFFAEYYGFPETEIFVFWILTFALSNEV